MGTNLHVFIADEILSAVGFFSLLYSAYTLVLDIELLSGREESSNPIIRLTRNRHLFRITLMVAVAMGVSAASSNNGSQSGSNGVLHRVSTVIFLVLTVLQGFQTVVLGQMERQTGSYAALSHSPSTFGARNVASILLLVSALLLVRETFNMATVNSIQNQNNERLWYPLTAVPEILAVLLFGIPGLVPDRKILSARMPKRASV